MFNWNSDYRSRGGLFGWRSAGVRVFTGVFMLMFGAVSIGPAISAAKGHGVKGYFVAQSQICGRYGCSWSGDFRLPGGQVTRTEVGFDGSDSSMRVGVVVPALDTGDTSNVFPRHGSLSWLFHLGLLVVGTGLTGYQIYTWARRRRGGTPVCGPDERQPSQLV